MNVIISARGLTPADEHVDDKVFVLREEDHQQGVQVQGLHQQPKKVGHDEVVEEDQTGSTAHLECTNWCKFRVSQMKRKNNNMNNGQNDHNYTD